MAKRPVSNISVHPNFNRLLRIKSALSGKSVYEFTKDVGSNALIDSKGLYSNDAKDKKKRVGLDEVTDGFKFRF
jgi:hypothetical protein